MSFVDPRLAAVPFLEEDFDVSRESDLSPLQRLERDMATEIVKPPVTVPVPSRPGYSVRFRSDVAMEDRERWERIVQRQTGDTPELAVKASALTAQLMVADTCEAILIDGVVVTDDQGKPVTFKSPWLWGVLKVGPRKPGGKLDVTDVVRKFYGYDGDIESVALKLIHHRDDDVRLDPTDS
ncbi:MAG: hypothetical protein M3256_12315 [Actinomycetota bacterium]|nr:hypothetical protein [Actinomycetota bacterium]